MIDIKESEQLRHEGYCVFRDVLGGQLLNAFREVYSIQILRRLPKDNFSEESVFQTLDWKSPLVSELICWPPALSILKDLGFLDPRIHSFYAVSKWPGAKALSWHQDLYYSHAASVPSELFLIYYLQKTNEKNGCLRVIPGSHKHGRRQNLHLAAPHSAEVSLAVGAGDLIIGDRRLWHSTFPNGSDSWRTCLTLAYAPNFNSLSEPVQALVARNACLPAFGWWDDPWLTAQISPELKTVLPVYKGNIAPIQVHP